MSVGFVKKLEASKQSAKSHNSLFALPDLYEDGQAAGGRRQAPLHHFLYDYV
jgi:hypothetical protein